MEDRMIQHSDGVNIRRIREPQEANHKVSPDLAPPELAWGEEIIGIEAPPTVAEFLAQVRELKDGLRQVGFSDEEQLVALIQTYFELQG